MVEAHVADLRRDGRPQLPSEEVLQRAARDSCGGNDIGHFDGVRNVAGYECERKVCRKRVLCELPDQTYMEIGCWYAESGLSEDARRFFELAAENPIAKIWLLKRSRFCLASIVVLAQPSGTKPKTRSDSRIHGPKTSVKVNPTPTQSNCGFSLLVPKIYQSVRCRPLRSGQKRDIIRYVLGQNRVEVVF